MKGTVVFVSGVVGGIVMLVWGAACFIAGAVVTYKETDYRKPNHEPNLKEVK